MEPKLTIRPDGTKEWYLNGKCHREDGPAIERPDGSKVWYLNGECHREDGPAVEQHDGTKIWYLNGKWHREDGPAIERPDGTKHWYLNHKELSEKQLLGKKIKVKYPNLYNNYLTYQIMNS